MNYEQLKNLSWQIFADFNVQRLDRLIRWAARGDSEKWERSAVWEGILESKENFNGNDALFGFCKQVMFDSWTAKNLSDIDFELTK